MKNQVRYKIIYLAVICILLMNLFFTYLLKYNNQDLSISEFSLWNPGNFFNFLFTLIPVTGLIILIFKKEVKEHTRTIITLLIIINLLLILAALISQISLPLPEYYILDYHISRVIVGFVFAAYQFMLLVFLSVIWLFIFGYRRFLILRGAINAGFIIVLLFLFAAVYLNLNRGNSVINSAGKKNIGVVLGAAVWSNKPSPSLSSRADKAAGLLKEGKISFIQLTGSNAPGELSESQMAYNYLQSKDLDMNKVLLESETTSTNEQIKFIKNQLYSQYDIVIISDGYHLARIKEICSFQHMKVDVAASDLIHSFRDKLYYNFREAAGILIFWLFAL